MKKLTILAVLIVATVTFFCFGGLHPVSAQVDADADGVLDAEDLCLDTAIPEAEVPTVRLGTNRWALTFDSDFDTTAPRGKGPSRSFSIVDTAGCSCEQIIEELGLGKGHSKFGCSSGVMELWIASIEEMETECSDGIDNDTDGDIDYPNDAGCTGPEDDDEQCPAGFDDCDQAPQNGCETDIETDLNNCGECQMACPAPGGANQVAVCEGGGCSDECAEGFADCDQAPQNGCEINTDTDNSHCGACDSPCAGTCEDGVCNQS